MKGVKTRENDKRYFPQPPGFYRFSLKNRFLYSTRVRVYLYLVDLLSKLINNTYGVVSAAKKENVQIRSFWFRNYDSMTAYGAPSLVPCATLYDIRLVVVQVLAKPLYGRSHKSGNMG